MPITNTSKRHRGKKKRRDSDPMPKPKKATFVKYPGNDDIFTRRGLVTGKSYVFSGLDKIAEIDRDDLEDFLGGNFVEVKKSKGGGE